jgi:hypothetical protein
MSLEYRDSHIFDGKTLHKAEATYQLIDITDGQLYDLIREPIARRSSPDVSYLYN